MKWEKKGLLYAPTGARWWAKVGAQLPTVEVVDQDRIRVYYASKDADGYGRIGAVDLDSDNPGKILSVAQEPVLDLGEIGAFDDCGVVPNTIIDVNGDKRLYYQGFQRSQRVPYLTFTGLAIRRADRKRFEKFSRTPITDRTNEEPFIRSTCSILRQGEIWKMWYVSTIKWTQDEHGLHYICVVRHATSKDGLAWETCAGVCLEPDLQDEYAVGRPSVVYEEGKYKMWYSIRSFRSLYRIGYAESRDGVRWVRKDDRAGIEPSKEGWDSEMICYPFVVDVNGKRLMFYNGNGRGATGFGYAILEKEE
jgi:predicted GH43/DUF377 family glycosyl hydrolase